MQLPQALQQIDGLLDLITPLLSEDNPDTIEQAITQMRDSMAAFVGLVQRFEASAFTPENVTHMQRISERLAQIRAHIVKVGAINQQQLQALMPQQGNSHTYGGAQLPAGAAASVARLYHVSG